jgi:uncharacterized RDD family membrane protein YckC
MENDFRSGGLKGQYAGFISRLMAYMIDLGIIVIVLLVAGLMIEIVTAIFPSILLDSNSFFQLALAFVAVLATAAFYYIFFWTLMGKTPGKMLMGLRIVSLDGSRPTFWQSVRRFIGYFLSALLFYAGYWWVLLDNRRQGWHDKLAGTVVVYSWDARLGDLLADRYHAIREESDELT